MDLSLIFQLMILLFSAVIHEVSHGLVALWLGDHTAQRAGRLTLNPLPHIDPIGTVLLPLMFLIIPTNLFFAWAKPVPYNPYNLRDQKWGPAMVGLAGPSANILLAFVFGVLLRIGSVALPPFFVHIFVMIVIINLSLAFFNLIPIPPLDGSKLLLALLPSHIAEQWELLFQRYGLLLVFVLIMFFSQLVAPILFIPISFLFKLFTGSTF